MRTFWRKSATLWHMPKKRRSRTMSHQEDNLHILVAMTSDRNGEFCQARLNLTSSLARQLLLYRHDYQCLRARDERLYCIEVFVGDVEYGNIPLFDTSKWHWEWYWVWPPGNAELPVLYEAASRTMKIVDTGVL